MNGKELCALIQALPEDQQNLPVKWEGSPEARPTVSDAKGHDSEIRDVVCAAQHGYISLDNWP
jgi:hypothetical protein